MLNRKGQSKIISLSIRVGRRTAALVLITTLSSFGFRGHIGRYSFQSLEGGQFVHSSLVGQDVSQVVLNVLNAEGLPKFAEVFLGLVDNSNHRVSNSRSSNLLLKLEMVSSLSPDEFERFSPELESNFLQGLKVDGQLLMAGVQDMR